jgi:glutamyl/glutaminyl-tRNA synthetase
MMTPGSRGRAVVHVAADVGPYRQSERLEIYQKVAQQLWDGGHAYPCFCSEEELEQKRQQVRGAVPAPCRAMGFSLTTVYIVGQAEAEGRPPQYDGTWRDADPAEVSSSQCHRRHRVRVGKGLKPSFSPGR